VTSTHPVNRATIGDARSIAALFSDAFHDDPVSEWLIPDPHERRRRHMRFFLAFVEHALLGGEVQLHYDNGYAGAALWLDGGGPDSEQASGPDMDKIREALSPDSLERFQVLGDLMRKHHPVKVRHAYLTFVGVLPQRQGNGIGRLLLETKLAQLDRAGTPAYLEASNARSRNLYVRLGFRPLGDPFTLPGGPAMYPLWREPPRPRWTFNTRWASSAP
jgi:ribosomal protein S18 acetylase RimI-like enzyme